MTSFTTPQELADRLAEMGARGDVVNFFRSQPDLETAWKNIPESSWPSFKFWERFTMKEWYAMVESPIVRGLPYPSWYEVAAKFHDEGIYFNAYHDTYNYELCIEVVFDNVLLRRKARAVIEKYWPDIHNSLIVALDENTIWLNLSVDPLGFDPEKALADVRMETIRLSQIIDERDKTIEEQKKRIDGLNWRLKAAKREVELHDAAYGLMREDYLTVCKALAQRVPGALKTLMLHDKGQELDKVHLTVQSLRNRISYLRSFLTDITSGAFNLINTPQELAQMALDRDNKEYTAAQERAQTWLATDEQLRAEFDQHGDNLLKAAQAVTRVRRMTPPHQFPDETFMPDDYVPPTDGIEPWW